MAGFRRSTPGLMVVAILALGTGSAAAQDDRPVGWTDQAELTFVMTAGNASSSTFGLKNALTHYWPTSSFQLSAGGVRTESGLTTRTATGSQQSFQIQETTDKELTAENYFVRSRYDHKLDGAYLFGGAGWDRNTFAGIQNRYGFVSGAGKAWVDSEERRFKTDLGVTYTIQDDVVADPSVEDSFLGLRASYDAFRKLTETTAFASVLTMDENLNETSDLRADWVNSLTVAMSQRLALKTSLQLLFDNQPALVSVPLSAGGTVLAPLGKTDSVFTVAIVANF
ncbi:MAG: DUF481 domain-containing protein [Gemmatimonadota bacterium]